jgi:Tol biopolymer transport system component
VGPALPVAASPYDDILPVYSPDGRFIAFSSNRSGMRYNIYIYDKSNGKLYQLTNGRDDFFIGGWLAQ